MQTEKVSLISRVGTLSLYFSRTQLLLLALSLECLGKNKASILLHDKHQLSSPEAHLLPQYSHFGKEFGFLSNEVECELKTYNSMTR